MCSLKKVKVRVVPHTPHSILFGGFEVQMLAAMDAARASGSDVSQLDFWSLDKDFDTLHVWGFDLVHANLLEWATKAGKNIVLSALLPYPNLNKAVRHLVSSLIGPAKFRKPMLKMLSVLTVVNEQQANYAEKILSFPRDRIKIIPNIVDNVFFDLSKFPSGTESSETNGVICTGNICERKNQLNLVLACKQVGLPVVLLGGVLSGEEAYAANVEKAVKDFSGGSWIKHLSPNSPEIVAAYRSSKIFALPSFEETQPISALEAAATGLPVLLADRAYARQRLYKSAMLVNPKSVKSISNGLLNILASPNEFKLDPTLLESCRRASVGELYIDAYKLAYYQK